MSKLLAIFYFILSLYGCDVGDRTFIDRSRVDGSATLHGKVADESGGARFECLRSATGRCYYTLFPHRCAATAGQPRADAQGSKRDPAAGCRSRPFEQPAIEADDSRRIAALPRFHPCASADSPSPGPDCGMPAPIAAR